jgi:hypothetical protein
MALFGNPAALSERVQPAGRFNSPRWQGRWAPQPPLTAHACHPAVFGAHLVPGSLRYGLTAPVAPLSASPPSTSREVPVT